MLICFVAFEIALRRQSTNIAPRCSARPRNTIHNGFAQEYLPDHAQHRCGGNWIKWVMTLDYNTLLTGVPGTGTRNDGLSGSLLHVTLDSIVLLRFHALGRKLTTLATVLCIGLLLPLYVTTPQQQWLPIPNNNYNNNEDCSSSNSSKTTTITTEGEGKSLLCSNITLVPYHHKNLYKKMTLGNVPNLYYFSQNQDYFKTTSSSATNTASSASSSTTTTTNNNDDDDNIPPEDTFVFRLRASVLVVWLVTLYAFYLLQEEWVEIVKLRRIWYLQQRRGRGGGGGRCKQKSQEMKEEEEEKKKDVKDNNDEEIKSQQQQELLLEKDWYEGLLLPSSSTTSIQEQEQLSGNNDAAIMKEDDDVDKLQLKVVDEEEEEKHLYERHAWIPHPEQPDTVPNVEPYSILLGPLKLQQKHHHNDNDDEATMPSSQLALFMKDMIHTLEKELPQEPGYTSPICAITVVPCAKGIGPVWRQWYATATKMRRLLLIRRRMKQLQRRQQQQQQQQQQHYNENMTTPENTYLRQVFGVLLDDQLMEQAQETMGPEQMGVYSRELAQAASNFCPYGCMEGQIYSAPLVKLIELERLQQEQVEDAKLELQRRQREFMFQQRSVQEESNNNINNEDEGRDDEEKCGLLMTKDSDHRSSYELSPSSSSLSSVNRVQQSRKRIVSSSRSSISAGSIASDDNEDDAMEMMELTAQSSSAVATTTSVMSTSPRSGNFGNLRIRQTRRRRFLLTLKKYSNQAKYQLIDLYQRYNTLAAWKDLIQNCSKAWSEEHTFVVITFTSRHAAAAARSVTKDLQDIPIPPLADAASCKLLPFRYFCRPVTVTVNNLQKACRLYT